MKTIQLITICLLTCNVFSQSIKEFIITDNSLTSIPYASVFIKGSTIGSYSDFNGKVSLELSMMDTILISCIGFENKTIKVSEISDTLILSESVIKLNEVEIKSEYQHLTIGFNKRKTLRGGSAYGLIGMIDGIVIKDLQLSKLKEVSIFIDESCDSSSTLFMLQIFSVIDSSNIPCKSLISKQLFFDDSKKGWSSINLDTLNIYVNKKVFIGIEIVPNYDLISDTVFNIMHLYNSKYRVNLYNKKNNMIYVKGRRGKGYRVEESYSNFPMIKATIQN